MTSGDKQNIYTWFIEGVKCVSQEFTSSLILNHETPNQKEFYELYVIHKFGAKEICSSEDKLVSVVMNLKINTKRLTWEPHLKVNTFFITGWVGEWVGG